jgi:DNA-binding winged helix-turn-helix (wHTH) protein
MQTGPVLRFNEFELDIDARELRRRGRRVKLAPQPFRLLALLAGSDGRVVDRETIRKQLWSGTFVDFEHGLNFCVCEVRRALQDRAERPKYIETLPKRGYRFLAAVEVAEKNGHVPPVIDPRVSLADLLSEGRRLLREMGVGSLDLAKSNFEKALELDERCAMAHCGLGATHAMRFISRSEPGDLKFAHDHLEHALALDPELAEPYPWLCYVHIRHGEIEHAIDFGSRGVQLLPGLVHAQYFLGLAYFASCEQGTRNYQHAIDHLLQAGRVEPRWPATWFVLTLISLLNGQYDAAESFAHRLFEYEGVERPIARFPGAENLMGIISLRRGQTTLAYEHFSRSMAALSASEHAYAEGMKAWCACGLGDVELRRGNPASALGQYRNAWQIVQEFPAMLAQERHGARALAGLATAYAVVGDNERAFRVLSKAEQRLESCLSIQTSAAGANLADLHYAFAVACLRVGDPHRAITHLRDALDAGWHDSAWLRHDPEFDMLRKEPSYLLLLKTIENSARPIVLIGTAGESLP